MIVMKNIIDIVDSFVDTIEPLELRSVWDRERQKEREREEKKTYMCVEYRTNKEKERKRRRRRGFDEIAHYLQDQKSV